VKEYNIYIEEKLIGTSKLENADVPMGLVFIPISLKLSLGVCPIRLC